MGAGKVIAIVGGVLAAAAGAGAGGFALGRRGRKKDDLVKTANGTYVERQHAVRADSKLQADKNATEYNVVKLPTSYEKAQKELKDRNEKAMEKILSDLEEVAGEDTNVAVLELFASDPEFAKYIFEAAKEYAKEKQLREQIEADKQRKTG